MNKKAVLSVLLSGILWGVINVFIRNLSRLGMDSMQIAAVRSLFSAVILFIVLLLKAPEKLRIRAKDLWMFAGTGLVSVTLFNIFYFYTMIEGEASVAVVLLYTSPVFIMLLSALIFKEKITGRKVLALVLTVSGCVFVAGLIGGRLSMAPLVFLTGILSGLFYGLYTIFGRFALRKYDSLTVTFWTFVFATLGCVPFGKMPETVRLFTEAPALLLFTIGIAVVSTILPYFLYTWGLQRMESSKAAILVAVEPLVGAILGMTVFRETVSVQKCIGILLILAAIIVMNMEKPAK